MEEFNSDFLKQQGNSGKAARQQPDGFGKATQIPCV